MLLDLKQKLRHDSTNANELSLHSARSSLSRKRLKLCQRRFYLRTCRDPPLPSQDRLIIDLVLGHGKCLTAASQHTRSDSSWYKVYHSLHQVCIFLSFVQLIFSTPAFAVRSLQEIFIFSHSLPFLLLLLLPSTKYNKEVALKLST